MLIPRPQNENEPAFFVLVLSRLHPTKVLCPLVVAPVLFSQMMVVGTGMGHVVGVLVCCVQTQSIFRSTCPGINISAQGSPM